MSAAELSTRMAIAMFAMALAGCGRGNAATEPASSPDAFAAPASAFSGQGVDATPMAIQPSTSKALFARLDEEDRSVVQAFYGDAGNAALAYGNAAELAWLQRHGYPMPSDALEAIRQTDDELRGRIERGDAKAGYFLLDRLASRSEGAYQPDGRRLAEKVLVSGSPYSGYAFYAYHSRIRGDWALALSGLLWASYQGDTRALDYYNQVSSTGGLFHEALAPGDVGSAFLYLLSEVHLANPSLLSRPLDIRLKYL